MPPANHRKNGPPKQPSEQKKSLTSGSGFPALQKDSAPTKTKYEEVQDEEILALKSIFGDDFEVLDLQSAGAWKKRQPCFKIHIKSTDNLLGVVLQVQMTATYPKSPPLLVLSEDEELRDITRQKIKLIIRTKPEELIATNEGPIIYDLVDLIHNLLDEAADVKATSVPSLEDERAIHEHEAAEVAKAAKAEKKKKKELANMEEQRMLQAMVQDEMKKREKDSEEKRKERRSSVSKTPSTDESEKALSQRVSFDHQIKLNEEGSNPVIFQSVTSKCEIRRGPVAIVYTVRPVIAGSDPIPILVLKETELKDTSDIVLKKHMHELEAELEKLKKVRNENVLRFIDFKVHKTGDDVKSTASTNSLWTVSILTEYGNKGSLEEVLDLAGDLPIPRVRAWTHELLSGLDSLHKAGIIHQAIQASNVLLVRDSFGKIKAKLADGGYQRQLHILGNTKVNSPNLSIPAIAQSAYWRAPENIGTDRPVYTQKTDVWDFGTVFLNMIFGMGVVKKYTSPNNLTESINLTPAAQEFVDHVFEPDPRKRSRASDLKDSHFLAHDVEVFETVISSQPSVPSLGSVTPIRQRHNSMNKDHGGLSTSRYQQDFIEEGRLGKGGFGEVMKVRKKLDGQFYAVKKIVQKPSSTTLTEILKEVRLLSLLSHPYVVRYYNTWTEEIYDNTDNEEAVSSDENFSEGVPPGTASPSMESKGNVTGDLDFISSGAGEWRGRSGSDSGEEANIEFGYDTGEEAVVEFGYDTGEEASDAADCGGGSMSTDETTNHHRQVEKTTKRSRSGSHTHKSTRTILYIQMEFCARRTLRDLIKDELYKDKQRGWQLLRQMLEALAYIHDMNVVHRDLKPENVFMDSSENIRLGDFGLATSGQFSVGDKHSSSSVYLGGVDMTKSIGTAFYVAPELRSSVHGLYTGKVDMYSLGVIFFEMCYPAIVGMERAQKIGRLREKEPQLPEDFDVSDKKVQADIILSLLVHSPKERPSASELLRGGKLPEPEEEERIKQMVAKLSDSNSDSYKHIVNALFSIPAKQAKDFAWDMASTIQPQERELLLQSIVKQQITSIFRRHGALETRRALVSPRSRHYTAKTVQLLDPSGLPLQLAYDLTLPNARALARQSPPVVRSFTFGEVYRPGHIGAQPRAHGEVDFDIVSLDTLDLALREAEVIKVMDEIVDSLPSLDANMFAFHINHANLLRLIFQFCRIDNNVHDAVAEVLSRHNVQWSWSKIQTELRGPLIGVSSTSLNDLQQFDFRDPPRIAFNKLKAIFKRTDMLEKVSSAIGHINDVVTYLDRLQIHCKCLVSPISSMNQRFYKGGIMFQCVNETKKRDVFAAGGRYDSLIREHRAQTTGKSEGCHAVGFNFGWEKVSMSIAKLEQSTAKAFLKKQEDLVGIWTTKRCDVLVASFDPSTLRNEGIQIVAKLWAQEISAELAVDSRSLEELQAKYAKDQHTWIVIIKQDSIKVKSMARKEQQDVEMQASQLVAYIKGEIRDVHYERARPQRHGSLGDGTATSSHDREVRILMAETRSKKTNRRNIVEQAQEKAASLIHSFRDGPIAAIETTDRVLNMIRETSLSDPDSWKNVVQSAPMAERRYIKDVHELLQDLASQNDSLKNAFVYNFRTGTCIYYDLASSHTMKKGKDRDSEY